MTETETLLARMRATLADVREETEHLLPSILERLGEAGSALEEAVQALEDLRPAERWPALTALGEALQALAHVLDTLDTDYAAQELDELAETPTAEADEAGCYPPTGASTQAGPSQERKPYALYRIWL
jgi:hypothetical protein